MRPDFWAGHRADPTLSLTQRQPGAGGPVIDCVRRPHAERVDEGVVASGDASPGFRRIELAPVMGEHGVGPDAASDGEAGVATGRRRRQPPIDRLDPGPGAENHHSGVVAPVAAGGRGDRRAAGWVGDALDLPHVGRDAGVLDLGDRVDDEAWPDGDLELVAAPLGALRRRVRSEQLEQETRRAGRASVTDLDEPIELSGDVGRRRHRHGGGSTP